MPVVMATNRALAGNERRSRASARVAAFTLTDLLVSMAIIAVLISLLMPTLASVREATRRVVCMSNVRQQGLCLSMFVEDNKGEMPESRYLPKDTSRGAEQPQHTHTVREEGALEPEENWDGLGILYRDGYINAPQVFYCPSHRGSHPFAKYASLWPDAGAGKIFTNFQFRGTSTVATTPVERVSLLTDALATRSDFSHSVGSNVLRGDFSVSWLPDPGGRIAARLPQFASDFDAAIRVIQAWGWLDDPRAVHAP